MKQKAQLMRRDFTTASGIRPAILNDMDIAGYKLIGCDHEGRKQFREVYRDGLKFYSWVYTITKDGDAGSVYGPLTSLK